MIKAHFTQLAVGIAIAISASAVTAQPVALDDAVLNQVTAGSESNVLEGSGGAVVGNSSSASIHSVGSVSVSDGAQSEAQSLNLVNSSESTVANGLNIWDGQLSGAGEYFAESDHSTFQVQQSNEVNQEQRRSAAVPEYSRPEANTFEQYDHSGSQSGTVTLDQSDSVTDLVTSNHSLDTASSGTVDTIILLQAGPDTQASVQGGKGVAVAGHLDAQFDAGEVEVGLAVGAGITVGGGAEAGGAGIEVGASADTTVAVYGRIELPEFAIDVSGAGCGVLQGSCTSQGSTTETTSELADHSTLQTLTSTEETASDSHEIGSTEYRSPFSLHNAQAEYIVVDDSSIDVSSEFSLNLSGSAQSSARAINVVNASGSAVANGVNISRTTAADLTAQGGNIISLSQSNVIAHSR